MNANKAWLQTLRELTSRDIKVVHIEGALGSVITIHEILNHTLLMDMTDPCITVTARNLPLSYAAKETLFVLSGSNLLSFNDQIQRTLEQWSEDKIYVRSAYGPRFVDQLPYILDIFKHDLNTRRAVISVWRDSPSITKDTTCLVTLQYIIRNNRLHCIANMRSSDAWLGLPNDITVFSYLAEAIRLRINTYLKQDLKLGILYCNAGSRHIYAKDAEKVKHVLIHEDWTVSPKLECENYNQLIEWLRNMG